VAEETLLENQATASPKTKLVFRYLPGYALFIKENYLVPYVQEQIRLSHQVALPMLKFFAHISDDELISMSIESSRNFLIYAEENRLKEQFEKSLQIWVSDQMGIIKRHEVTAEDLTLASYIRKKAMIKFLPSYTTDVNEAIEIIKEIDTFTVEMDTAATDVYIKLLKDRINEQAFFTEIISNTTQGLQYVFDIANYKIKSTNKNYLNFFGYSFSELEDMDAAIIPNVIHPDDIEVTMDGNRRCALADDGDVISWEYRLKNKEGKYYWMRNYASVFKRNEQSVPVEIVGIILDIDTEKKTGDKLLLREKQLLDAQAQARLGSFELDVETGKMDVTPQFKEIYELTEFDLYTLIDHVHPADRDRINANRDKAIAEDGLYDNEYRYLINDKEKVIWSRGVIVYKNGRKVMTGTAMDVTDRNKMIQSLVESKDLYRQAQELSHIGNWTWDLTTGKIEWSEELYKIYGMTPGVELYFEDIMSFVDPDDAVLIKQNLKAAKETLRPLDTHFHITLKDGTRKVLHAKTETLTNAGIAHKMVGTIQDVTEKQLLIEQLQNSEHLYKQAQAISHIGNWSWEFETKKLEWSEELYRIYELEPYGIDTNTALAKYNHPDDEQLIKEAIKYSIETLHPFDFNYRVILKYRTKTLNARGEIKTDGDGKPFKIYGTVQDITVQKNVERQLKEYQEFIEKITDVTPSIIAAYNIHTGQFSFVNDAVEKLLGYSTTKVMEDGVAFMSSIVHLDDIIALMEKNTKALEEANLMLHNDDEPIVEFKYRMQNANGKYRWFHTYGTIFERNEKGLVESVLNISVDITEQELAEQALYQKNLLLQQSNTSLEEYAYVASHDLKEPLRKITTFSDRILTSQYEKLNEESKSHFNKIISAANRMQKMINDLLQVSTILGNTAYEPCDLNVVLVEAIQPLDHKIEESKAVIDSENLPTIPAVPSQLRQLFQNLIGNSLKFAKPGVPPHIKITHKTVNYKTVEHFELAKAKKYLWIDLQDDGIGFDNQYSGKIFAIFQRLHGKSEYDGTGIGLAICKKVVENHGGIIFAKSNPGKGALFTIIIPE